MSEIIAEKFCTNIQ